MLGKPQAVLVFLTAAVVAAHGDQSSPVNRAWPPVVQRVSASSPALPAAEEMKTFVMPPGYHVDLVAAEPLVQDPILIDWDPDGRLWAIEMPSYMHDVTATDEHAPTGRIVVLEDTDNDGKMDKRTVFADGLVLPRALKVLDHGVLVGEPPNLWLMRDTNGDLKSDTKEIVTDQFGRLDANVEHNANGLLWALDNWMYTSEADISLRLKDGRFEVKKTPSRGQWGASQDDAGRVYRNTNESVLHVDIVPTPYYGRNPNLLRTRGSYESLEGDDHEVNTVWPVRPTRGVNRGYQNGILRADGTLAAFTSVNSPLVYRGDRLPGELYGNVFVAEPAGNLVSRVIVEDDGESLESRKAYDKAEFLASTDERFRPVYLSNAPDGTLYVVDMYRGIIEHKGYITEYLRDQIVQRKLEQPTGLGRIYRVMHDSTRRDRKPALSAASPATLVETLSHPNGWWRDTAQRLLVERGDKSGVPLLKTLAEGAPEARTRLHALWSLDGLDSLQSSTVLKALEDPSRDVRASALRLSERWLRDANQEVQAAVIKTIDDQNWAVRDQLAATLGALPAGPRETAIAMLLERHADNPVVMDAAASGLRDRETAMIEILMRTAAPSTMLETAMTVLSATAIRGGEEAASRSIFEWAADSAQPEWQRSAILRGAEAALLGSALPGTTSAAGRGAARAAAPCPTCPGARTGPGGAPAFPSGLAATAAPAGAGRAGGRGSTGPVLRLPAAPAALVGLAGAGGDLGSRAAKILAHVEWPGKPGAAAVAPLTPQEQASFNTGETVYKNLCQACHQADGRGQDKIAASLVGSAFAVGTPEIGARILLNGKEGKIGLMPPLGNVLTDDQIAGALTYVRRQWGNAASAVDPAIIRQVRTLTATRSRPWTDQELSGLMK